MASQVHDVSFGIAPSKVSSLFTQSREIHTYNTRFSNAAIFMSTNQGSTNNFPLLLDLALNYGILFQSTRAIYPESLYRMTIPFKKRLLQQKKKNCLLYGT